MRLRGQLWGWRQFGGRGSRCEIEGTVRGLGQRGRCRVAAGSRGSHKRSRLRSVHPLLPSPGSSSSSGGCGTHIRHRVWGGLRAPGPVRPPPQSGGPGAQPPLHLPAGPSWGRGAARGLRGCGWGTPPESAGPRQCRAAAPPRCSSPSWSGGSCTCCRSAGHLRGDRGVRDTRWGRGHRVGQGHGRGQGHEGVMDRGVRDTGVVRDTGGGCRGHGGVMDRCVRDTMVSGTRWGV